MKENLKKLIHKIKESLKEMDSDGVVHGAIDHIYEYCEEMGDIIYNQEDDGIDISEYMD
jgi:hypothetical protein